MTPYLTKPSKHGTLYLWRIQYHDVPGPDGTLVGTWRTWAYDAEHAWENWHDSNEGMGFAAVGEFQRVREAQS
jgi:hypothetical protein